MNSTALLNDRDITSPKSSSLGAQRAIEWTGSALGLVGALLLALNLPISKYGFVAFLVSNLFWIAFALRIKAWGLLCMQLGFTLTSVAGIWRWWFI